MVDSLPTIILVHVQNTPPKICPSLTKKQQKPLKIHPGRLTWNLQTTHLERKMIFQTSIIMVHVNLPGCKPSQKGKGSSCKHQIYRELCSDRGRETQTSKLPCLPKVVSRRCLQKEDRSSKSSWCICPANHYNLIS